MVLFLAVGTVAACSGSPSTPNGFTTSDGAAPGDAVSEQLPVTQQDDAAKNGGSGSGGGSGGSSGDVTGSSSGSGGPRGHGSGSGSASASAIDSGADSGTEAGIVSHYDGGGCATTCSTVADCQGCTGAAPGFMWCCSALVGCYSSTMCGFTGNTCGGIGQPCCTGDTKCMVGLACSGKPATCH